MKNNDLVQLNISTSGKSVIANLIFHNSTGKPIYIDKINAGSAGELENDVFQISTDSQEIEYIGIMAKRIPVKEDFYRLDTDAEFESKIRLENVYRFLPGKHKYKIRYYAYHTHPDGLQDIRIESKYVDFIFEK